MVRSAPRLTKLSNSENPSEGAAARGKSILFVGGSEDETRFRNTLRLAQVDNAVTAFHLAEKARNYLIRVECGADYTAHLWPDIVVLYFDSSDDEVFRLLDWLNDNRVFGEFVIVAVARSNEKDCRQRACDAGVEAYYSEAILVSGLQALFQGCGGRMRRSAY